MKKKEDLNILHSKPSQLNIYEHIILMHNTFSERLKPMAKGECVQFHAAES